VSGDAGLPALSPAVLRAMTRWPDVPACHGWLGLDARGYWLLEGGRVGHAGLVAFLAAHYRVDDSGAWYVQNGPQRAYVDLAYTPWVLHEASPGCWLTHTGLAAGAADAALLDEDGALVLLTARGAAVVDDRDLTRCLPLLEPADSEVPHTLCWGGRALPLRRVARVEVPRLGGFVARPRPA